MNTYSTVWVKRLFFSSVWLEIQAKIHQLCACQHLSSQRHHSLLFTEGKSPTPPVTLSLLILSNLRQYSPSIPETPGFFQELWSNGKSVMLYGMKNTFQKPMGKKTWLRTASRTFASAPGCASYLVFIPPQHPNAYQKYVYQIRTSN